MDEILRDGFAALGVTPPAGASEQLLAYYDLLTKRGHVMNLTAISGEEDTARLHFLDCATLLRFADLRAKNLVDVGSGAGFPGLVLRILEPEVHLTLLDSQQKRVGFLEEVCALLGFSDVRCMQARAEEASDLRESFDAATSRAVARLDMLCELCLPLVQVGGLFLAMKGPDPEEELRQAANAIQLLGGQTEAVEKYRVPGTDVEHSIVCIRKITPTPAKYPRRFAKMQKQPL